MKWIPANVVDIIQEIPCEGYVEDFSAEGRIWDEVFDRYGSCDRWQLRHEYNDLLMLEAGLFDQLEMNSDGFLVLYRYKKWMKYDLRLCYRAGKETCHACSSWEGTSPVEDGEKFWVLFDSKTPETILDIQHFAPMEFTLVALLVITILVLGLIFAVGARV